MTGLGFNMSNLLIPVRESDMIFTVIGENFGFVGGLVVIALYFFDFPYVKNCALSNSRFYTYIATGYIMMLLFHIFENIGAATGILPLTGIPLPFISQGVFYYRQFDWGGACSVYELPILFMEDTSLSKSGLKLPF